MAMTNDMSSAANKAASNLEAESPTPINEEMCECPECSYKGKKSEFMPMDSESEGMPEVEVKIEAKPTETGDTETSPADMQDNGTPQSKRMSAREAALKAMKQ